MEGFGALALVHRHDHVLTVARGEYHRIIKRDLKLHELMLTPNGDETVMIVAAPNSHSPSRPPRS